MKRIGLVTILLVFMAGCGIGHGKVIDSGMTDAMWITQCTPVGKVTVCTPYYYPSHPYLTVQGDDGGTSEESVTETEQSACTIGEQYPACLPYQDDV